MTEATELADLLTAASRTGAVCVLDLDGVGAVTLNPDQVVQAGSAFKIAVALEVYCQASARQLDLDEHLRFIAERAAVHDGTIEQAIDHGLVMTSRGRASRPWSGSWTQQYGAVVAGIGAGIHRMV